MQELECITSRTIWQGGAKNQPKRVPKTECAGDRDHGGVRSENIDGRAPTNYQDTVGAQRKPSISCETWRGVCGDCAPLLPRPAARSLRLAIAAQALLSRHPLSHRSNANRLVNLHLFGFRVEASRRSSLWRSARGGRLLIWSPCAGGGTIERSCRKHR